MQFGNQLNAQEYRLSNMRRELAEIQSVYDDAQHLRDKEKKELVQTEEDLNG